MKNNQSLPILIAEDSDEDFDVLVLTFRRCNIVNPVLRCESGEEVLTTLDRISDAKEGLPCLIFLDLNLIGLDGREVLKSLKTSSVYKHIPVIVLTTSANPKDVNFCYEAGANSYSVKPVDLEKFENFIGLIKSYWFDHSVLPMPLATEMSRRNYV